MTPNPAIQPRIKVEPMDIKPIITEAQSAVGNPKTIPAWHEQMVGALAYMVWAAREEMRQLKSDKEWLQNELNRERSRPWAGG